MCYYYYKGSPEDLGGLKVYQLLVLLLQFSLPFEVRGDLFAVARSHTSMKASDFDFVGDEELSISFDASDNLMAD